MKKAAFVIALIFIFSGNIFAQQASPPNPQADNFVRSATTVPDFSDTASGWVNDPSRNQKSPDGTQGVLYYANKNQGLMAFVYIQISKNGSTQEFGVRWGSANVGRAGIKVNGKWHLAKGPFFDNPTSMNQNNLLAEDFKDNQGNVVGYKIKLDTLDGPKELVILF